MFGTIMQNTILSRLQHYCNSKSAEALSLNVTHNWFDDIRNFNSFQKINNDNGRAAVGMGIPMGMRPIPIGLWEFLNRREI